MLKKLKNEIPVHAEREFHKYSQKKAIQEQSNSQIYCKMTIESQERTKQLPSILKFDNRIPGKNKATAKSIVVQQ